jgi:hypothetical protein
MSSADFDAAPGMNGGDELRLRLHLHLHLHVHVH